MEIAFVQEVFVFDQAKSYSPITVYGSRTKMAVTQPIQHLSQKPFYFIQMRNSIISGGKCELTKATLNQAYFQPLHPGLSSLGSVVGR